VITNDNTDESIKKIELELSYPIALKANDSIEFYNTHFEGKKKAYKIYNNEELVKILNQIYNAGYTGKMIAQDFIPGDSSDMYVLNAYVNTSSQVKMMSLGKCLLDEVLPLNIGNYNALVTMGDDNIYKQYKKFLDEISYTGFANFDLKYDKRDGKYKVFEINIRQGRSSFYMNAAQ
ncbi:MAG: carboxylate--amine ligase, partial [Anaerococcus obesiensis]